ncbi:hypothetical protein L204_106220 [Cryptococcus depauperatus]
MLSTGTIYPEAALVASFLGIHGYRKGSLSRSGAIAAFVVGYGHLANPVKLFGVTMIGMYLLGSRATKIKADVKAKLEDGPDPYKPSGNRNWIQVLSNSLPGLIAALCCRFGHASQLNKGSVVLPLHPAARPLIYLSLGLNATVLADTLASELGILSVTPPIHILTLQHVPPGTNGGVSILGIAVSILGGALVGLVQILDLLAENPACTTSGWVWAAELLGMGALLGLGGSVLDSLLGASLQATYYNTEEKRVVTDSSQKYAASKALPEVKRIEFGMDVLSNSSVNLICSSTHWSFSSRYTHNSNSNSREQSSWSLRSYYHHPLPLPLKLSALPLASESEGITSPDLKSAPLSPSSQGVRTPKPGKTLQLTSEMDGLNVRSPVSYNGSSPLIESEIMYNLGGILERQDEVYGKGGTEHEAQKDENDHVEKRSLSGSTDSNSSSQHPVPPSHLGSSYGSEGFPTFQQSPENSPLPYPPYVGNGGNYFGGVNAEPELAARQAAALAKADEAVRQLNNTSTLFQGPSSCIPHADSNNSYQLPRNYANFVVPHLGGPSVTRQSSTSSYATDEASTSSEESDWCIPSIEWVPTATQGQHPTYPHSPAALPAKQDRERTESSKRMPPPSNIRRNSHRSSSSTEPSSGFQHQSSLPVGASSATPPRSSQISHRASISGDVAEEDEDDDVTVGQGQEHSPSTSSQSAQSGLDLLWRAAHANHPPYDASFDHKGKRKAGAEAVDKWRTSGIPMGPPPSTSNERWLEEKGQLSANGGPPRKRRRSELQIDELDENTKQDVKPEDNEAVLEETGSNPSRSTSEGPPSDHDSEYGGRRGRALRGRGRGRGTGRPGRNGPANLHLSSAPGGVTKQGTIKKVRKVGNSPTGAAKNGKKVVMPVPPGGVQCDYINPLPPYNRCTDVFTRKYDLPRHMARHARREGELVVEGKLAENKAVLWKTIKDKPKVVCNTCSESFTRMDALKRHQQKQHH